MSDKKPNPDLNTLRSILEESNAGIAKIILRNKAGDPIRCYIAVDGEQECREILDAIEAVERGWDDA